MDPMTPRNPKRTEDDHAERGEHQEDLVDEALDETFPASDPISPSKVE
jgi:hypothetical protein